DGTTLTAVSGQDGVYTASLTGIRAGEAVITPAVEGSDLSGLKQTVALTADKNSAGLPDGSLTVVQDNAVADDTTTNKVQVVVTDANGNPVAGVPVSFSAPSPAHVTVSDYATDVNGVATAALASPAQGSVAVSAEANGSRRQVNVVFAALSLTVKATDITGVLDVGQTLEGQYSFSTNGNNTTDNSTFDWSGGGQSGITTQDYKLNDSDVGKILTFSVTARTVINGVTVTGNTDSISTKDAAGIRGGSGVNPGEVIDPTIAPAAKDLNITGKLEMGEKLTGHYTFVANGGDTNDKSTYQWLNGGQSGISETTYILNGSDVGKILTFEVTPVNGKGVKGTPVSISTDKAAGVSGGDGKNPGGVIDPNATPVVKATNITGPLEVGGRLEGVYTFSANGADGRDMSTFAWRDGGQSGITTQTYELNASDIGKILTFSVTAVNGAGVTGNTDSISTKDAAGISGGSGMNPGEVIDPTIAPAAKDLNITGTLEVGQMLTGSYTFVANGGDTNNHSTLLWTGGGQDRIAGTSYTLNDKDVGKILTFEVTPVNGKDVKGTPVSINTKDAAGTRGSGSGKNPGEVIDPKAKPIAEDLNISGPLEVGQTLTGSYTFNPNGGDTSNRSTLAWRSGVVLRQSGVAMNIYTLVAGDVGNILTFEVTPENGRGVKGDSVSTTTSVAAGVTGGDAEHKGMVIDPAVPSAKLSELKSGTQSITADGKSEVVLTFVLKNAANDAITGPGNNVVFDVAGVKVSLSGVSEAPPGTYTAKLTGTLAGTADVSVKVNGQAVDVKPVHITLTAGTPDGAHSALTVTPESIVANNGNSEAGLSTVKLTLNDTQGNRVTGLTDVNLTVTGVTGTTLTKVTESPAGSGVYTATLSGTTVGTATLSASAGGAELNGPQAQVTLTADITTATVSTVTESTTGAKADNVSTNTLTATVKDANGNPVPNATVAWNVTTGIATLNSATLNSATSDTDGNGQAVMTVKDTTAETATVTAKVGSNAADSGRATDTVFSLYPVVSGITQGVNNSPADDVTVNTLTVQIADMAGNALANQAVTLSVSSTGSATLKHGATVLTAADGLTATTDGKGQLLLEATDVTSESVTVSASVNNGSAAQTQTSAFGLYPVLGTLEVGQNEALANNTDVNRYVATVTDKKGNVLADTPVTLTFSLDSTTAMADGMESPWTGPTDGNGRISV
ncbi:hypothetical protein BCN12_27715, partial [Salmonella enterica]|nr:hypothetical protein [Salmonella enterica]